MISDVEQKQRQAPFRPETVNAGNMLTAASPPCRSQYGPMAISGTCGHRSSTAMVAFAMHDFLLLFYSYLRSI